MFPGIPELLVILLIVLLIFGAGKLPAIGDALGRSIKNFRRSSSGKDEIEVAKQQSLDPGAGSKLSTDVRDAQVVGPHAEDQQPSGVDR